MSRRIMCRSGQLSRYVLITHDWQRGLTNIDLPGLRQRRPSSLDGPDDSGGQFVHYRRILWIYQRGIMDRQRIFHVSITSSHSMARLT